MRKRTTLLLLMFIASITIQLFGIPYLGITFTDHELEFDYVYNWDIIGTGGWYSGYSENFRANGHYEIDHIGTVASVSCVITWTFQAWLEGYLEENYGGTDYYSFTYSLTDGQYLSPGDQEYDATGLNVWFHIPGGIQTDTYSMLNETYEFVGDGLIWSGHLMPFTGKRLVSAGQYSRDDVYGQFEATYTIDEFFTPEGYLIGEILREEDKGYSSGYYSEFVLNSYVFITSSSYLRPFCIWMYLLAYWFPLLFFAIIFYVVYEHYRWKPRVIRASGKKQEVVVERKMPGGLEFSIESPYSEMILAYLSRAKIQGKTIVSAHNQENLKGIGFIEPNGKVGTFFGKYSEDLISYTKVKYAHAEVPRLIGFKTIEKYDVFKIEYLQGMEVHYDANLIEPARDQDLDAIMRLIANEDSGTSKKKDAKWVIEAAKSDIIVIATVSPKEEWVKDILTEILRRNYRKPEIYLDRVLLGVGFATPGNETGWLYGLYVHPAFRNKGIGRALVNARLSILKELGCNSAITEIAEWNSPAKGIYDDFDAPKLGKVNLFGKKMPKVKVRRF
ncbi:MAG: GNAT family N-acetyltransferase [Candidatus Lokiarchaeota archaeon]|nr:GNAT family N-acetyltransferase [Candidatus Lokiarchaeota archaeon]